MSRIGTKFSCLRRGLMCAVWLGASALGAESLAILKSQTGTTPLTLGYNLGHFMPDSNAADWFRHSGVDGARIFMSAAAIEPNDDIAPVGDGVTSETSFFNRRALLRANAGSPTAALSNTYVNWPYFIGNYPDTTTSGNRLRLDYVFGSLRDMGVEMLANITASPSRFPIAGENDWPAKWELWQHYYAQAFLLSRDYGVRSFGMFNEPNGVEGLLEADWLLRLRICSDAIQCAIEDMNSRHARNLIPRIFAPNTASGAEKYDAIGADDASTDTWGRDAVASRHLRLDGSSPADWMNLHVYNYQKYTHRQLAADGLSGFVTDYNALRRYIDADMPGEPRLPMALTEFNVRTGASYDTTAATQDSPFDATALGANCIALTGLGIQELYLFKFGQTSSDSVYGVAKNGTHYVQNASGTNRNYGGATRSAEVYRLFVKAAKGARPRHAIQATAGALPGLNTGLWSLATQDPASGTWSVFLANRETSSIALELDFSDLPVPQDNPVFVEEVSTKSSGGVVRLTRLAQGKLTAAEMPAESVWLVTLPASAVRQSESTAVADTQLGDGLSKNLGGGARLTMDVRADGSIDGRRASLIRIPVPAGNPADTHSVLLEMEVAASAGTGPVRAHVYGVAANNWSESALTWSAASAFLRQNVPAGNQIAHNIVNAQGGTTRILGQLVVDSPVPSKRALDVTGFVRSRTDGFASFLIVQDHRWDLAQPGLTPGDTQAAGLVITSREGVAPPRLVALTAGFPPAIDSHPQAVSVVAGAPASMRVTASGSAPLTYQWRKNGADLQGEVSNNLLIPEARESDAGVYQVVVGNLLESTTSNPAQLTVTAPGLVPVAREATIRGGTSATADVDEITTGYLMVKYSDSLSTARKSYFQFDLPGDGVDLNAAATFQISFQASFTQQVRLWGLNQPFPDFGTAMTWNNAPANDTASNDLLATATPVGAGVRISPGNSLNPQVFTLPRLGDFVFGRRVTLVLTGVNDAANNSGGLRIALASATLQYAKSTASPWNEWRQAAFAGDWQNEAVAGAAADPDRDGIANLLEYALSGNPMMAESAVLPTIRTVGHAMEFVVARNPQHADLYMTVQAADDPAGVWTDAASSTDGLPFVPLISSVTLSEDAGDPERRVTIIEGTPSLPRRFMRLRVELKVP